jgi:hypothetical protein
MAEEAEIAQFDAASPVAEGERILDQDEIDSLLGFDASDDPAQDSACRCWKSSSIVSCG